MLTRGKFIQTRQILFRFSSKHRKNIGRERIENDLEYLSEQGFLTVCDNVFFKNPHLTAEDLGKIGVDFEQYMASLDTSKVYAGFSPKPGLWQWCIATYDKLYGAESIAE